MNSLYQFFLREYAKKPVEYARGQLLINFALIEIVISGVYFIVHPFWGFHAPRFLFLLFSLTIACSLFLLRSPLSLSALANGMIFVLWINFCIAISYSGGIYSQILPWLAATPVLATLLVSHRASVFWVIVSLSSVIFFTFYFATLAPLNDLHGEWRGLASQLGLVLIIFLFTWLFYKSRASLLKKLAISNVKLNARKEKLLAQHREIQAQKSFIEKQNVLLRQQNAHIAAVNKQLELKVIQIVKSNKTLEGHWETLLSITKSNTINFGQLPEALSYIAKTVAKSLYIDRVCVWRFNKEEIKLHCLHLYDVTNPTTQVEQDLDLRNFPTYFENLRQENVITATHAQMSSATIELSKEYLKPRAIMSMMDTPFFISGELGGVLCCEHRKERIWTNEDILFAQALSDIVTISIMANQRRLVEANLIEKQSEIIIANETLENRVKARTQELEYQNKQLAEYAYINSHLLRAPLSRLLGLVNLMRYSEVNGVERETVIEHIQSAGEELDSVVSKINKVLDFENPFNRDIFSSNDN